MRQLLEEVSSTLTLWAGDHKHGRHPYDKNGHSGSEHAQVKAGAYCRRKGCATEFDVLLGTPCVYCYNVSFHKKAATALLR